MASQHTHGASSRMSHQHPQPCVKVHTLAAVGLLALLCLSALPATTTAQMLAGSAPSAASPADRAAASGQAATTPSGSSTDAAMMTGAACMLTQQDFDKADFSLPMAACKYTTGMNNTAFCQACVCATSAALVPVLESAGIGNDTEVPAMDEAATQMMIRACQAPVASKIAQAGVIDTQALVVLQTCSVQNLLDSCSTESATTTTTTNAAAGGASTPGPAAGSGSAASSTSAGAGSAMKPEEAKAPKPPAKNSSSGKSKGPGSNGILLAAVAVALPIIMSVMI